MPKTKAKPRKKTPAHLPAQVREAVKALPARPAAPEPRRRTIQEIVAERDAADARWRELFVNQPKKAKAEPQAGKRGR